MEKSPTIYLFDLQDPERGVGLYLRDDLILGRAETDTQDKDETAAINLDHFFDAASYGVSRQHVMLRPTNDTVLITDLESTNGTFLNRQKLGPHTPRTILEGDTLSLGRLKFGVRMITGKTEIRDQADLAEALIQIGKTLATQLDQAAILDRVLELVIGLVQASEASIWLIEPASGELFLEAQRGIDDETIQRLRIPVSSSLPGEAIETGRPLRVNRQKDEGKIKIKTGYMVESVLYVPLIHAGNTLGVLSAVNQETNDIFSLRDEKILTAIGDFAAIAIQNARLYEATDQALTRRSRELSALNQLSAAATESLDLETMFGVLKQELGRQIDFSEIHLWAQTDDGLLHLPTGETVRQPSGIVGHVLEEKKGLSLTAISEADAYDPAIDPKKTGAALYVPLVTQDQAVGVVALFNQEPFTAESLTYVEQFVRPMATAVYNVRLYTDLQRESETINVLTDALNQPIIIIDDEGETRFANRTANAIKDQVDLVDITRQTVGKTKEVAVGDDIYIVSAERIPNAGTIGIMQDVSYLRRLEHARSEMSYALSHDMQSPISSLRGFASVLQVLHPDDKDTIKHTEHMMRTIDRIIDMVNQLLDLATLQEKPEQRRVPVDLREMIQEAVDTLQGAIEAKSMALRFNVTGEPYLINGDDKYLYRCMLNLIDNAIKYSPQGAQIIIQLGYTEEAVTIVVEDTGQGISEDDLPHIFDKYYQSESGESLRLSGVGMGLELVRMTVLSHGGTITADNSDKGGAAFVITLPGSLRLDTPEETQQHG